MIEQFMLKLFELLDDQPLISPDHQEIYEELIPILFKIDSSLPDALADENADFAAALEWINSISTKS